VVVGQALAIPLTLGVSETEAHADAVCVVVSLEEPKEAEAEPLWVKTLAVGDIVAVRVWTVCVAS
jgi:hypothetical protein